jgi:serine/threonine-protein phosphatase PP1 catalytic subunit
MPCSAIVGNKILCMHGGISPELKDLNQLKQIHRPTEVPESGLICDLLWADPDHDTDLWQESDRGVSYTFSSKVLKKFCDDVDIDMVCRAH